MLMRVVAGMQGNMDFVARVPPPWYKVLLAGTGSITLAVTEWSCNSWAKRDTDWPHNGARFQFHYLGGRILTIDGYRLVIFSIRLVNLRLSQAVNRKSGYPLEALVVNIYRWWVVCWDHRVRRMGFLPMLYPIQERDQCPGGLVRAVGG